MNGAESLIASLVGAGVRVCFTNPGTSEMHFVAALDRNDDMRAVLGLFEGVVTGAADGYGRMTGRPACTLLHLGPGLANGLANLHNARRAFTPIVNIVGDHATYHRHLDAPLTSDIAGFASPVSTWIRSADSVIDVGRLGAQAVQAALEPPGRTATIILPADTAWSDGGIVATAPPTAARRTPAADVVESVASALRSGARCALLLTGNALTEAGLERAGAIAVRTGARLLADTFVPRISRGAGRIEVPRVPYFGEQAVAALEGLQYLILVGAKAPVSFFAYPGKPSELTPEGCAILKLADIAEDGVAALSALAELVGAGKQRAPGQNRQALALPQGALTPETIAQSVAVQLPENAIISNEAATSGFAIPGLTAGAAPHDWLDLMGGAIGQGLPVATGAAVACPDRKVVALQADGSAMYTLQALWTQAREGLDVTTVLFANRKYAILQVELARVGANSGPKAMNMLQLDRPDLDWVSLAKGMGVPGERVTTAAEFNRAFGRGLATPGPYLIEAALG